MPIRIQCSCGQALAVKDEFAGKTVKCPKCQQALQIPRPAAAATVVGGTTAAGGMDDLFDDVGLKPAKDRLPTCPSCRHAVQPNAVLCVNCGYDFRSGSMRSSVGSVLDNISLKSDAERRVAKAAKNLSTNEIQNNSDSFGDSGSIWAWLMPFALPFLLAFSAFIAIYWGLRLGSIGREMMNVIFYLGWYEMAFPILIFGMATSMFYTTWWNVSVHCIRVNVWLGMLSLGTLGVFTPWFGMPFWKDLRFTMILYAVAFNLFIFSAMCTIQMLMIRQVSGLTAFFIIPALLFYAGFVLNYVYWMRLTAIAFTETMTQGMLCMFTYLYAPIYGIIRWQYCKWETMIWLGSLAIMAFAVVLLILFSVLIVALPTTWEAIAPPAQANM